MDWTPYTIPLNNVGFKKTSHHVLTIKIGAIQIEKHLKSFIRHDPGFAI